LILSRSETLTWRENGVGRPGKREMGALCEPAMVLSLTMIKVSLAPMKELYIALKEVFNETAAYRKHFSLAREIDLQHKR